MKYTVYILVSSKGEKRYIGMTSNLEGRIEDHSRGLVKSTKYRKPLKLVYTEEYNEKKEAHDRENFFKTGKGKEYLNNLGIK